MIHSYQAEVIQEVTQRDYDGEDIPSKPSSIIMILLVTYKYFIAESPWNFSGALLYSITVITTIGKSVFLWLPPLYLSTFDHDLYQLYAEHNLLMKIYEFVNETSL